jgi:chorismate mutase / prephenate dehydratase
VISVAYQGIRGSFSSIAARKALPERPLEYEMMKFEDIFAAVQSETATYGMVPIENSLAGSIVENFDLLTKYEPWIVSEVLLPIEHSLLVKNPAVSLSSLRKVFSHPKALEQCTQFLSSLADIEVVTYSDTARAAKKIADENDTTCAAIASEEAGVLYGLHTLKRNIEDEPSNMTRFLLIEKRLPSPKERGTKASISFTLAHEPGSLYKVLHPLAQAKANLMKIESRPIKDRPFEYRIYIDFSLAAKSDQKRIEAELQKQTTELTILGWYEPASPIT